MSKTATSQRRALANLQRTANTRIEVEGLHKAIVNDLLIAYGVESFTEDKECISLPIPGFDTDPDTFRIMYLKSEVLSKFDSFDLGINTESAAWKKFHEAEDQCRKTNLALLKPSYHEYSICSWGERCIHTARQKITKLLGETPSLEKVLSFTRFSGGASTTNNRLHGHPSFKFGLPQDCTPRAVPYVMALRQVCKDVFDVRINNITPFNKAVTVPKNSKTDRCIAIEPGWNMFFQLGVGGYLRNLLRRWNIDLNDQCINQRRAQEGSISNSLATVDLSSASDTISQTLVELLLPPAWVKLLFDLRSPAGKLPSGETVIYEKISSMGNGFTFELESLIFSALARATCDLLGLDPSDVSVYGDDIILPSQACDPLIECFSYVGFTANRKKTFADGPFRESCGKHYFAGVDVTPFYIRHRICCVADMIKVLNNLYRWATIDGVWDPRALPVYQKYVRMLPRMWQRNVIPDGFGDGALVGSILRNPFAVNRGWIRHVPVLFDRQKDCLRNEYGSYISRLYTPLDESNTGLPQRGPVDCDIPEPVTIRRNVGGYEVRMLTCSSRVLAPFSVF